jgi:hypothetical protein
VRQAIVALSSIALLAGVCSPYGVARAEETRPTSDASSATLKTPKRGAFPFAPWSYAKAYTYNFFPDRPSQRVVVTKDGTWSPHIRSEQRIDDRIAQNAAQLTASTQGSIELTKCTFPRHAIVFFDASDKPVAAANVCFDCEGLLVWPDYPHPETFDHERAARTFEKKALPDWRQLFATGLGLPIDYRTAAEPAR